MTCQSVENKPEVLQPSYIQYCIRRLNLKCYLQLARANKRASVTAVREYTQKKSMGL